MAVQKLSQDVIDRSIAIFDGYKEAAKAWAQDDKITSSEMVDRLTQLALSVCTKSILLIGSFVQPKYREVMMLDMLDTIRANVFADQAALKAEYESASPETEKEIAESAWGRPPQPRPSPAPVPMPIPEEDEPWTPMGSIG